MLQLERRFFKEENMKNLKKLLIAGAILATAVSANADCCVTNCYQAPQCVKTVTKYVPYKVWTTVCVPVYDSCGNCLGYKKVKTCTTKYKTVKQQVLVDCCCN